jgi:hypothetical protein
MIAEPAPIWDALPDPPPPDEPEAEPGEPPEPEPAVDWIGPAQPTIIPRGTIPAWQPWPTWDCLHGCRGPLHGPRQDLADGSKVIPWPTGTDPDPLLYFATADHCPPAPGSPLILAEGEKTADAIAAAGYAAAGTVGSKASKHPAVYALLAGYDVTLAPDDDEPGRKQMGDVARELELLGAVRCRIIRPPADAPKGWDLADVGPDRRRELIEGARELLSFGLIGPAAEPSELAAPDRTIGSRTARDLRHGMAPPQLADPFLTAEGSAVIYARGGTGKGLLACWLALRLVRSGHVVMVIDFEGHEMEWGTRLRGLGLADDELGQIHYRAPFGSDWTAPTGSLSAVADAIRDDAARLAVTYIVVDSYSVATSNGDTMGGEAAAREYFSGLARIGLPSLTIAHVRGDSGKFPERPFGSVFVHNLSRETWAVERIGDDDPEAVDPDEIRFGPYIVALELRNKKANARPKGAAQFVTFSFFGNGTIEVATDGPGGRSVADLAADALAEGPLTLSKIAAAIKEDTGQVVSVENIRSALARHPQRFSQDKTGKRPYPWAVR